MILGFSNRLINTYGDVCNAVSDIALAIEGDPRTSSQYRLIPFNKSGKKNFVVNAVDFKTLNETVIFISGQTIGVKLFSKNHTPECSYSVSRKDGVQVIKIEFPDGTGMEQRSVFDDYANAYLFDKTTLDVLASEVINIDDYEDEIINEDLKLQIIYAHDTQTKLIKLGLSFIPGDPDAERHPYDIGEYESLQEISGSIAENAMPFIQAHANCLSLTSPKAFYSCVHDFKTAFTEMINQLEKNQGSYNPSEHDGAVPHSSDR